MKLPEEDKVKILNLIINVLLFIITFPLFMVYYAVKGQSKKRRR